MSLSTVTERYDELFDSAKKAIDECEDRACKNCNHEQDCKKCGIQHLKDAIYNVENVKHYAC